MLVDRIGVGFTLNQLVFAGNRKVVQEKQLKKNNDKKNIKALF